jgi:hypothetical protein
MYKLLFIPDQFPYCRVTNHENLSRDFLKQWALAWLSALLVEGSGVDAPGKQNVTAQRARDQGVSSDRIIEILCRGRKYMSFIV